MSKYAIIGLGGVVIGLLVALLGGHLWRSPDLDTTQKVMSAVGVLISAGSLVIAAITFLRQRAAEPDLERFANDVFERWDKEATVRGVRGNASIRVRWTSTARPVTASPSAIVGTAMPGRVRGLRLAGDVNDIAAKYWELPRRQLVVLGAPGGGKSTLALLMLLELLRTRAEGDPVPYLVPLVAWEAEPVHDWLAGWIARNHRELGDERACRRLLTAGRIVPILDGFDELPAHRRVYALKEINAAVDGGKPLILTCRTDEYQEVIAKGQAPLATAAVVELRNVSAEDAEDFFDTTPAAADRWKPVLARLRAEREGELAAALSTPLMVSLARTSGTAPGELLSLPNRTAVQHKLLDGLIPAVYAGHRKYRVEDVVRWMTFLAAYLERMKYSHLDWWRLHGALPAPFRWLMTLMSPVTALGAATGWITAKLTGWPAPAVTLVGLTLGFLLATRVPARNPRPVFIPHLAITMLLAMILPAVLGVFLATGVVRFDITRTPDLGPSTRLIVSTLFVGAFYLAFLAVFAWFVDPDFDQHPYDLWHADLMFANTQVFWPFLVAGLGLSYLVKHPSLLGTSLLLYLCLCIRMSHACTSFRLHRWLLALSGRLPRDLLAFLHDAHQRGLLRLSGSSYEFRHQLLRSRLAERATKL